jgi:hypothetical protein
MNCVSRVPLHTSHPSLGIGLHQLSGASVILLPLGSMARSGVEIYTFINRLERRSIMKYGFVYIWYDKKHKRYYVGAHWGTIDDGYVCSSPWMKQAYKHRPEDFKRKILSYVYTNTKDMFEEEYRWLSMMKPEELKGNRYYNTQNYHSSHWSSDETKSRIVKEKATGKKLSAETIEKRQNTRMLNNGYNFSEETKSKMSDSRTGAKNPFYGKTHSEDTKKKISDINMGKKLSKENIEKRIETRKRKNIRPSEEQKYKTSNAMKLIWAKRKENQNDIHTSQ